MISNYVIAEELKKAVDKFEEHHASCNSKVFPFMCVNFILITVDKDMCHNFIDMPKG